MLLTWLHPDRDDAGSRYEDIRRRLLKLFASRGCPEADVLADETMNRVASKVQKVKETYTGDPALYFYGVAHNIHLEYLRKRRLHSQPRLPAGGPEGPESELVSELESACLDRCMQELSPPQREMILQYYQEEKHPKILHRKALAERLGVTVNTLRIRAHRIRASLRACMQHCLEQEGAG